MISECLNALKMKSSSSFLQNRLGFSTRTFAPERIHPGLCFSFSFYTSINCDDLNVLTGAHLPGQHDQGVQDVPPVLRAGLHEDGAMQEGERQDDCGQGDKFQLPMGLLGVKSCNLYSRAIFSPSSAPTHLQYELLDHVFF